MAIAIAISTAKRWQAEDGDGHTNSTCVIASSQQVRDSLARQFSVAGLAPAVIDANQNLSSDVRCTNFATMHRAKGLEFDRVIFVTPAAYLGDPVETEQKRKLIYVALTRAERDALLVKMQ